MIHALHGAIGHYSDWDNNSISAMELNAVNLWQFLVEKEISLKQAAYQLNESVTDPEAVILGYSMGGRLALQALLLENSPWKKAIIVSASTGIEDIKKRALRVKADALWSEKALALDWQDFLEEWNQQGVLQPAKEKAAPLASIKGLKSNQIEISRAFKIWSTGRQDNLLPQLSEINIPVLWVTGAEDKKFNQIASSATSKLPQMQHCSILDCGHRVPWEKKAEFASRVDNFLSNTIISATR